MNIFKLYKLFRRNKKPVHKHEWKRICANYKRDYLGETIIDVEHVDSLRFCTKCTQIKRCRWVNKYTRPPKAEMDIIRTKLDSGELFLRDFEY